jgi:hypothetical protein
MEYARVPPNLDNAIIAATDRKNASVGGMRHARQLSKQLGLPFNPALLYHPSCVVHRIEDINL